ncbi:hypothetical protein IIA16_06600, partial [bacterium]|nr:hypothetical protein [bacterium]
DSLLRRQMDEWFQRVTISPLPEGVGAAAVLEPIAASLAGLSGRLSPGFRGWLHLMHGRPVAAYDEFVLAAAADTAWVDAIHILVAAATDPDQERPVASAADLAFALYREVPPNERGEAFSHLGRDLRRVRAWWGESKELPPAYDFTLGMSLLYLGQDTAADYLDPLRQDPVWGPLVERLDALLGGTR